jgi:serine/threonine protein kinase/Tfp pilus assembly protein PilF
MRVGPYEVLAELGRGGMGIVYRVRTPLGGVAALKLLVKAHPETFARFERESRLLAELGEEEGFVGLVEAGTSPEGRWIVMPYVSGGTLRQRLDMGPLEIDETVTLGIRLARALGRAHAQGIVHRDVKPENVLFTAAGRPLIADLGFAKHFDPLVPGASQSFELTDSGASMGTGGYTAQEQLADAASAGPRSDVFSLGALLYECLAARPTFPGESAYERHARASAGTFEPIGRADVPVWLEAIVVKALSFDPAGRFANGAELGDALARGPVNKSAPANRRGPVVPLALGVVAGVLVLAAAVFALGRSAPPVPPTPAPSPPTTPSPPPSPRDTPPPATADSPSAVDLARSASTRASQRDWDGAIADATKALELDPALAIAWKIRSNARMVRGDVKGAATDAARAIEIDPLDAESWCLRGVSSLGLGERDEAFAHATRAIELDPKFADAWRIRGAARGGNGDREGEIADSTRAIELDPRNVNAWRNRGLARMFLNDGQGAMADLSRAIELDPTDPGALVNRGFLRRKTGDLEGSIQDVTRALELAPDDAKAWAGRGRARYEQGDLAGAASDLERSLDLDHTGNNADERRHLLESAKAGAR